MFAMLDKNDDGKIVQSERPGRWGGKGMRGDNDDGAN
jgi:hypothetical protein